MKDGIQKILGKRILSVVVGENKNRSPRNQIFLIFEDGTSFELWGSDINGAGGLDNGGVAESITYIEKMGGQVTARYIE